MIGSIVYGLWDEDTNVDVAIEEEKSGTPTLEEIAKHVNASRIRVSYKDRLMVMGLTSELLVLRHDAHMKMATM